MICCWQMQANKGTFGRVSTSTAQVTGWLGRNVMMLDQPALAADEVAVVLGEVHPLVEQLGSTEGLIALSTASAALRLDRIASPEDLRNFLNHYRIQVLEPLELPAITRAFGHAARNQTRELLALDRELGAQPIMREWRSASLRVGRSQLRRLRPLRDQRLVLRYLAAVENGRAHGWHTVVFGLTLALFSLPLRHGLCAYARRTLRGFIHSAARSLDSTEAIGAALLEEQCACLPKAVNEIVQRHAALILRED